MTGRWSSGKSGKEMGGGQTERSLFAIYLVCFELCL